MHRSIVFVLYFLFPFIVGLVVLILLTLHHADARDFCSAHNLTPPTNASNFAERCFNELEIESPVAVFFMPLLVAVFSFLYIAVPNSYNEKDVFRWKVTVVTTIVFAVFILNMWVLFDDQHANFFADLASDVDIIFTESGKAVFRTVPSIDMLSKVIATIQNKPTFTLAVLAMVYISAGANQIIGEKRNAEYFHRGHLAGMAAKFIALLSCAWFLQLVYWHITVRNRNLPAYNGGINCPTRIPENAMGDVTNKSLVFVVPPPLAGLLQGFVYETVFPAASLAAVTANSAVEVVSTTKSVWTWVTSGAATFASNPGGWVTNLSQTWDVDGNRKDGNRPRQAVRYEDIEMTVFMFPVVVLSVFVGGCLPIRQILDGMIRIDME